MRAARIEVAGDPFIGRAEIGGIPASHMNNSHRSACTPDARSPQPDRLNCGEQPGKQPIAQHARLRIVAQERQTLGDRETKAFPEFRGIEARPHQRAGFDDKLLPLRKLGFRQMRIAFTQRE